MWNNKDIVSLSEMRQRERSGESLDLNSGNVFKYTHIAILLIYGRTSKRRILSKFDKLIFLNTAVTKFLTEAHLTEPSILVYGTSCDAYTM